MILLCVYCDVDVEIIFLCWLNWLVNLLGGLFD